MKKQLLSSSAIAIGLAALSSPLAAQEWDMKWGGYHTVHIGYANVDSNTPAHLGADFDGVDVYTEAEI